MRIVDRDWNPIVDYEEFTTTEPSHRDMRKRSIQQIGCLVLIIFPKGSLRSLIQICERNAFKTSFCNKQKRIKNTVLNSSIYYTLNSKNLTMEEKVQFTHLKRDYLDVFQLADDIRVKMIRNPAVFTNIEIKVVFETSWDSNHSILMSYLRWTGSLELIRRFVQDAFAFHKTPIRSTNIQLVETQNSLQTWYFNSFEGKILNKLLARWGFFKETKQQSVRNISSQYVDEK